MAGLEWSFIHTLGASSVIGANTENTTGQRHLTWIETLDAYCYGSRLAQVTSSN